MTWFRLDAHVDAPLDTVWEFYSTVDGLIAITPDWMGLDVESIVGPEGRSDPDVLHEGSEITLSARPFGVGLRREWTSQITRREKREDRAVFEDEMIDGPFPNWVHTHEFRRENGGTRIADTVEYELPPDGLGRLLSPAAFVGLEPMFRYRHRRTRELLASE